MTRFASKAVSLPLAALVATLATGTPQAGAANLFDALFGGGIKKAKREEFPPPPPAQAPRKAAPITKISAPSYYNYKVDSLKKVDFAKLAAVAQSASLDATTTGTAFRDAVGSLSDYELMAESDAGKAIVEYYSAHPDFIWVTDGDINDRARSALRVLADAGSHGLLPSDYGVSVPASNADAAARQAELMRFEMTLSARVLRYVHDSVGGRIDPNRISGYHDFAPKPLDMVEALTSLAAAPDPRAWLESKHPQSAAYKALRVELETLEASAENEIVVDAKLVLKPGETNPELAKLLQLISRNLDDDVGGEFGPVLARLGNSETYVEELVPVIKAVQAKAGLKADGVIGPRTVSSLAGTSKADRMDKVLVALEQLRWMPEVTGTRVFINQPAYTAQFIEGDTETLNMRVVVGKPSNQTSFFYDEIEQIDYNPYWGVPQSIIVNEMLPRLRNDPGYLDRAGYEVSDAKGKRIASSSINWAQYGGKVPFNVRQAPSEANALGELKILFPNKHAIYMHDTPQKEFFKRDARAFSHGCVRLQDPRGMAAAVLGTSVDHVVEKLGQGHSFEKTRRIPVFIAYFTAWPDQNGKVDYFADVYDRDAKVKVAMEKTEAVRVPAS